MPPKRQTKPDDWEGPQKITPPASGCSLEEMSDWLERMKTQYHTLNRSDRAAYQKVRNARKNRHDYTMKKDDPVYMAKKNESTSVSKIFYMLIKHVTTFMNIYLE